MPFDIAQSKRTALHYIYLKESITCFLLEKEAGCSSCYKSGIGG